MAEPWIGFFQTIAQVAVTLLAIAFLTFTIRDTWRSDQLKSLIAVATLLELNVPLFVSLIILLPGHPWKAASWAVGAGSMGFILYYWVMFFRTDRPDDFDILHVVGSPISLIIYTLIFISPFAFGLYVVSGLLIWLIVSGVAESWRFLEVRGHKKHRRHARLPWTRIVRLHASLHLWFPAKMRLAKYSAETTPSEFPATGPDHLQ